MQNSEPGIVILGGGLSGLTSAYLLKKAGYSARILEARLRLGGRIETLYHGKASLEMGATWLGQKHQHLIPLLEELGLEIWEQFMDERAIYEPFSTSPPQLVQLPPNPEPSYRIQGGSSSLIQALASHLDPQQVLQGQVIHTLHLEKDHILLEGTPGNHAASFVINTLPPRLMQSRLQFHPDLPKDVLELSEKTHTWMGESIKVGLRYREAFWRKPEFSGTVFSNVGPIQEMYDHSDATGKGFALKGFMNSAFASARKEERQARVLSQLERFYGPQAHDFLAYEERVWSQEPFTYQAYAQNVLPHQHNGHQLFREELWNGHLVLASSETAAQHPGYMDGAVESAQRAVNLVLDKISQLSRPA